MAGKLMHWMTAPAAAVILGAYATAANALPITYEFSADASANFGIFGTDSISGSFTYDPTNNFLSAANITVTGLYQAGEYTFDPLAQATSLIFVYGDFSAIQISFAYALGSSPDPLSNVSFCDSPTCLIEAASAFAGGTASPDLWSAQDCRA